MRCLLTLCLMLGMVNPVFAQEKVTVALSLKEALKRADTMSVNVVVANARVQQSLSQLNQTQATLLPQLSASLNGQRQSRDLRMSGITIPSMPNYTGPFNTFDARGKITQTIFDPSTFERLKTARLVNKLVGVQLQKAKEDSLALVAVLYIQAKRALQEARATKIFVLRDKKAYALAKTEYAQGTKTLLDLKRARADLLKSKYLLKTALTVAKERRLDLAAALQIDPAASISFDQKEDLDMLTANQINVPVKQLDIAVAAEQLNVAQAQVSGAKADYLPKVSLIGDYGRSGESPSRASNTYTIGVMATMPIWQGGSQQAKIAESKAKADEAQALLTDVKFQTNKNVIEAKENIAKAKALILAQGAQLEVSRQQFALVLEQYKNGLSQKVDVLRAKSQEIYDKDQFKEAVAVLWTSQVSLAKAQGQMQQMLR